MLRKLASIPIRIIHRYVGPADKNTIEYWQRFIFYVISLSGTIAGTLAIIPGATVVFAKGQYLGGTILVAAYVINVAVVFSPRLSIKTKTLIIAFFFSLIGGASLAVAGPEGESGIWFSVSTLICSLFVGPRIAMFAALLNLLTGLAFGVLHSMGLIGWDVLHGFRFHSWLIQSANIFFMDTIFVVANTFLIRGVGNTFKSLSAAEEQVRASLQEKETLIRELYHRSKNNMQVVSSLLSLHSTELYEESAKAVFKDVIDKIVAMSLVHQRLYESRDLSNIDMAAYVRDLAALMTESYGVSPAKVSVDLRLGDITIDRHRPSMRAHHQRDHGELPEARLPGGSEGNDPPGDDADRRRLCRAEDRGRWSRLPEGIRRRCRREDGDEDAFYDGEASVAGQHRHCPEGRRLVPDPLQAEALRRASEVGWLRRRESSSSRTRR